MAKKHLKLKFIKLMFLFKQKKKLYENIINKRLNKNQKKRTKHTVL